MRIKRLADSRDRGDLLHLGVQTNPEDFEKSTHFKANAWAPSAAKSYTIFEVQNTDYHGRRVAELTGYGSIKVGYFTTAKEGKHQVIKKQRSKS